MALTFGGAITDRVTVTQATSINSLNPFTWLAWVRPTTLTNARVFAQKGSQKFIRLNGTGGNIAIQVTRATTSTSYITNNQALATNTWAFLGFTFDSGATPTTHLYKGTMTAIATEYTYGTATDGSGGVSSDSANDLAIGNAPSGISNVAIQGQMATMLIFNRVLSVDEIISQQFRPRMASGCVLFHYVGFNGTGTQADWSGNANSGSVSGATVATAVGSPVGPSFAQDTWRHVFVAAAGAAAWLPQRYAPPWAGQRMRLRR